MRAPSVDAGVATLAYRSGLVLTSFVIKRFRAYALWAGVALLAPVVTHAGAPQKIEGYTFAGEVSVANSTLHLNGVGVRQVAWFKGYAAGLYLTQMTNDQAKVLAMPGPKRISMRMLIDAPSEEFAKAFTKGVTRNTPPDQLAGVQERMQKFDATVRGIGKLKKGDVVEVDWRPGQGTVALVNGKQFGQPVPGEDMYLAMLKIYIGDKPTDLKMKSGLLGAPAPK